MALSLCISLGVANANLATKQGAANAKSATNANSIAKMAQAPKSTSAKKSTKAIARTAKATPKATQKATKATNSKAAVNSKAQKANSKANSKTATNSKAKNSTKKRALVAQKSDSARGKSKTYGLMPSELNSQNQAVYYADAEAIRGARDTESALRYMPFITIVNSTGFGQQFDLRAQGRLSTNGVEFLINGISFNPLDSYYGFMPINSVLPSLIQEVAVYPSLGARGGTINVITSKRSDKPYFQVGAGYASNLASSGTTYNAHAQAAEKFGGVNLNAGLGYFKKGGPREGDESSGFEVAFGADIALGLGQSIVVDADFYSAKEKTTPYNSFFDTATINGIFNDYNQKAATIYGGSSTTKAQELLALEQTTAAQIYALPSFSPTKDDRKTAGSGEIELSHSRFVGSLGYESELRTLKLNLTGFYAFDKRKYDKYSSTTMLYQYGARYFIGSTENPNSINQSDSSFDESKFGARASAQFNHGSGVLFVGLESIYEMSKRNPVQNLQSSKICYSTGICNVYALINVDINTPLDISEWTNAVFVSEKYNFTDAFSVKAALRYQMTKSKLDTDGVVSANFNLFGSSLSPEIANLKKNLEVNHDNFAFEIAPAFRYSDTGVVFARYERGFSPVPAYAMLVRTGEFTPNTNAADSATKPFAGNNFQMTETNLEDESYNSYEIGFKDYIPTREIRLGSFGLIIDAILFSANAFYIDSKNEFYFTGDPYSGLDYATYGKSRRIGGEIALEQYLFGGNLGFNESFTYIKAEAQGADGQWAAIPYTYDYKATLGINLGLDITRSINARLWLQNSFYGKQAVISSIEGETLKPYMINDVGVSFGFNKNAIVVTAGVKNVLDTLYYDYYNNNKATSIGEYRYLLGQGRTWFIEGAYKY